LPGNPVGFLFVLVVGCPHGELGLDALHPATDYPALGGEAPSLDQLRYPPVAQGALQLEDGGRRTDPG
jgi:hypothetical protein